MQVYNYVRCVNWTENSVLIYIAGFRVHVLFISNVIYTVHLRVLHDYACIAL